jgi:protein-disulfide isomerase
MQMSAHTAGLAIGSVTMFALVGCAQPVDLSKIEEGLAKLEKQNEKILSRIDDVEKAAKSGARPAPRQPARPDSDTVHKVDIGEANWKGAKDAKVTIVEWSEFQ